MEYFSQMLFSLKKCSVKHEKPLEEGTRPDLIIERDENFKNNMEKYQTVILFLGILKFIKEIAVDFTIGMAPDFVLAKCFKNYHNKSRLLLIVVLREEGILTARYFQDLINNDARLTEEEKKFIRVINFNEYLTFLNLEKYEQLNLFNYNEWSSMPKSEKEIVLMFQKIIKLSINAIRNDSDLDKLTELKERYSDLLDNL